MNRKKTNKNQTAKTHDHGACCIQQKKNIKPKLDNILP